MRWRSFCTDFSFTIILLIYLQLTFVMKVNCWQLAARRERGGVRSRHSRKTTKQLYPAAHWKQWDTPDRKRQTSLLNSCRGGRTKRRGGTARRQRRPSRVSHLRAASPTAGRLGSKWGNSSEGETQNCCRAEASSLTQALLLPAKFNEFRTSRRKFY